jgi:hypothetical protein
MKFIKKPRVCSYLQILLISLIIKSTLSVIKDQNVNKYNYALNNNFLLESSLMFKSETRNLLDNLYFTSNYKTICEEKHESKINKSFEMESSKINLQRNNNSTRLRKIANTPSKEDEYYQYYDYDEIINELKILAKNNQDFLKIETAQELYKLPYPEGKCGKSHGKCEHYIAFLTDNRIESKNKHQIYISGEVHGDEQVGSNASLELIKLFLAHKDSNPWIGHLLKTRLIVLTPMTNPYGYSSNSRPEQISDLNSYDINRDFPYLVAKNKCMTTIGARVVNELFISHLFSLALTLHGGTESFTYPYGAPNHIEGNQNKIPIQYTYENKDKKNLKIIKSLKTDIMVEKYQNSFSYGNAGKSTEAPDFSAVDSIAHSANYNCAEKNSIYKVGDMSSVVYPVTGGMEDWAYAASWEGSPVITQPCEPDTYNGYDKEKTLYTKNYPDALKSIMFLLEISHNKKPDRRKLGKRSQKDECILDIRTNPFTLFQSKEKLQINQMDNLRNKCLDKNYDGYISKVLRLCLSLIDLLEPYINVNLKFNKEKNLLEVFWIVGGATKVDETYVQFNFTNKKIESYSLKQIEEKFKYKTKVQQGKALWDRDFSNESIFNEKLSLGQQNTDRQFLELIIIARVDKDWLNQNNPQPNVTPRTHIVNLRNSNDYVAKNGNFELKGKEKFTSKVFYVDLKNINQF